MTNDLQDARRWADDWRRSGSRVSFAAAFTHYERAFAENLAGAEGREILEEVSRFRREAIWPRAKEYERAARHIKFAKKFAELDTAMGISIVFGELSKASLRLGEYGPASSALQEYMGELQSATLLSRRVQ
jgi:hypothetical protein